MPSSGPQHVVALDIGGTKMTAAGIGATGLPEGTVHRAATGRDASGGQLWSTLLSLVERSQVGRAQGASLHIGVSCAGPFDIAGSVVSPVNLPGWASFPLRARLQAHYPQAEIEVGNDGLCMTWGEQAAGAAKGHGDVLGVTVSTGVGGGVVRGWRPVHGTTGNAGHIGHVAADPHGDACWCGARGCLETIASGPSSAAWALAHGWVPPTSPDGEGLAADAERGVPIAAQALQRAGAAVGAAVAGALAVLDVNTVVIGGGFSRSGPLFWRALRNGFTHHSGLSFLARTHIRRGELGDIAPLVGAGLLATHGRRDLS